MDTWEKLTKLGAGVGRCVLELFLQKRKPGEYSLVLHHSPAIFHMSVSHFSCDHLRFYFLLLYKSFLYPGFCPFTLSASSSLHLASTAPGAATSSQCFFRYRFFNFSSCCHLPDYFCFPVKNPKSDGKAEPQKKLNIELPFDPTIPLLSIEPKDLKAET